MHPKLDRIETNNLYHSKYYIDSPMMACPRLWSSLSTTSAAESYEVFLSGLASPSHSIMPKTYVQDDFWYITVKSLSCFRAFTEFNCSSMERSWLEERKIYRKNVTWKTTYPVQLVTVKHFIFAYKLKFGGGKRKEKELVELANLDFVSVVSNVGIGHWTFLQRS